MKILVVGSGGREHALAWRLAQSPNTQIFALPGNPGIAQFAQCLSAEPTPKGILAAAQSLAVDLTVIGPEAPLVAGVVDLFRAAQLRIVGPTAKAAQLEGSKIFAKTFFRQHDIPTADFAAVDNPTDATETLDRFGYPVVIKADGLAAGKGVIIAQNRTEAESAYQSLGPQVVIEEFLTGPEISFIVLSDGRNVTPLLPSRDHKRIFDGDHGPNTGGMGAFCDPHLLTASQTTQILETIIRPTVEATQFSGFLYAGLMMTADGPKLLEYNVRLGDPETQPLMYQLDDNLPEILSSAANGSLPTAQLHWKPGSAVALVLASEGYPGKPRTGDPITGIEDAQAMGAAVFHAGTAVADSRIVTNGGRVLAVTSSGATLEEAASRTYEAAGKIHFRGMQYRRDIGRKTPDRL